MRMARCSCCGEMHPVFPAKWYGNTHAYVRCFAPGVGEFRVYSFTPQE